MKAPESPGIQIQKRHSPRNGERGAALGELPQFQEILESEYSLFSYQGILYENVDVLDSAG